MGRQQPDSTSGRCRWERSFATGINDQGQLRAVLHRPGRLHGFLIDDGVMYDLNDLLPATRWKIDERLRRSLIPGTSSRWGQTARRSCSSPGTRPAADYDVVDLGAGLRPDVRRFRHDMNTTHQATGNINSRAFIHNGTTASYVFPTFSESTGTAINAAAVVTGYADNGGDHEAFRTTEPSSSSGHSAARAAMPATSTMRATSSAAPTRPAGSATPSLYRDGAMTDLHTLGGTTSEASRINEAGTVIGSYSPTLGDVPGLRLGRDDDDRPRVARGRHHDPVRAERIPASIVGTSGGQAFRYAGRDDDERRPPRHELERAIAINESGSIAGSYLDGSGTRRGFLLDDGTYTRSSRIWAARSPPSPTSTKRGRSLVTRQPRATRGYLFDDGELIDLSAHLPLGYEA